MHELHWGLPVIGYLFLAGLGAGAMTVGASLFLRGHAGESGGEHFELARYGALIAPLPLAFGTGLLVFELGSFQAAIANGEFLKLFKFLNLFTTINLSPMSLGSWLIGFGILLSVANAWLYWPKIARPGDGRNRYRKRIAWVVIPVGIAICVYTGILLGALPARPFWNTPVLAIFFLVSALSSGIAAMILVRAITLHRIGKHDKDVDPEGHAHAARAVYILAGSDLLLISAEILLVFVLIIFANLTIGSPAEAMKVILPGGSLAGLFWFGVVIVGLVIPGLIALRYVTPTLLRQETYDIPVIMEICAASVIILGGFLLRYVVVVAGQITGPVGI